MKKSFLFAAIVMLISSCSFMGGEKVRGNGNIITQAKEVAGFKNIDVSGAIAVRLKQEAATSVSVTTDENLMQDLEIKVDGNTLHIHPKNGYNLNPSKEITVYVSTSTINGIHVSGASNITSDGPITSKDMDVHASGASDVTMQVKLSKFTSELSGASTLKLTGDIEKFSAEASGASKIKCFDLKAEEVKLDISGASNAEINAEKELSIEASGASNVEYRGNANINQKSSGASNVKKVD